MQLQVEGFGTGIAPTKVGQEMERAVIDPSEIILMAQTQMERRLEAFRAQFDRAWEGARQENQQWQSSIERKLQGWEWEGAPEHPGEGEWDRGGVIQVERPKEPGLGCHGKSQWMR